MARILAAEGKKVLAIDADPDSNLASAVGLSREALARLVPIASQTSMIEERTGAKKGSFGSMFKLNPKVDDLPDTMGVLYEGVDADSVGMYPPGGRGVLLS